MSLLLVSLTPGSCHGAEEGGMAVWLMNDQGLGVGSVTVTGMWESGFLIGL